MARKTLDDLFIDMMVNVMEFPTSLAQPMGRLSSRIKDFDKQFESCEDEFKELCENFEREVKEIRKIHGVKTDIIEKDNKVVIKAEMPGFKKEDILINIEKEFLVISAETKEETTEEGSYISREIRRGKFQRVFDLEGFDKDSISARYEDGILYVEIEKLEKKENEVKRINIM